MIRTVLAGSIALLLAMAAGTRAADAPRTGLSAEQIVEKHLAARGGQAAWRAVHTLSASGQLDAGSGDSVERSERMARLGAGASVHQAREKAAAAGAPAEVQQQVQLPFRLEIKRPRKSRLEIDFAGKTAVQVYDGTQGWKLRPFLNRSDVEPFTAEEAKQSAGQGIDELEGPLLDYAAKGTRVHLEGQDSVAGRPAYRLKLTLKDGATREIWIDTQNFLDVKVEGIPRRMDGRLHRVFVTQSDFRSTQGLMIPYSYDTQVEGYRDSHRMLLQAVLVNPPLEDARFAKPQSPAASAPAAPVASRQ